MKTAFLREANLIDGQWVGADSGATIQVTDPASGDVIGVIPNAGAEETSRAIAAAAQAFSSYRHETPQNRAAMMRALYQVILDHIDELAELLTLEQGKPLAEARGEITMGANYILWFAEEARRIYGDIVPSPWAERKVLVTRQPVGVVGAITPWNFPASMIARKIGPALACGCSCVIKPATQTPYSGLAWGVLCEMAGFPPGVVNIVTGSAAAIGGEMTRNELVRKITFTGSTEVGKLLLKQSADTVKKVSMELGGNAPFLVFDDADIDQAVTAALGTKYRNSGQTCVCANRFYVQEGVYDDFVAALGKATAELKVGNGRDADTQQGPLIDEAAALKVEDMIADALSKGAKLVTGGKRHALGGTFFEPTVLSHATDDMMFAQDEIFGPLAPVFRFSTEDQGIKAANNTRFGLAAYLCTRDLGRAMRVSDALEYGLVGINEGVITSEVAPFGGFKESGLGREGGREGIYEYVESKYVCVGGLG